MKTFKIENEPKIESGFIIPENYFDHFSEKVIQKLPKEEPKIIPLFSRKKSWIYTSAAVIVLGLSIPIYHIFHTPLSEIDASTLENYIIHNSSISDEDLVLLLDKEDIQKINIDSNLEDKVIENELSNSSNLEQYLVN